MLLLFSIACEGSWLRRVELLGITGDSVFDEGESATCRACHAVVDDLVLAVDDVRLQGKGGMDAAIDESKVRKVLVSSRCLQAMAEYDLAELPSGRQMVRNRRGSSYVVVAPEVNEWVKFELQEFCSSLISEHRDQVPHSPAVDRSLAASRGCSA